MKSNIKIDAVVEGIISYLKDQKAMDLLPEVAEKLNRQSWVRTDPNLAIVLSPVKLTGLQKNKIKKNLTSLFNRKITLKNKIDKSIIGGFQISVSGKTIDASINTKLKDLKNAVIYG